MLQLLTIALLTADAGLRATLVISIVLRRRPAQVTLAWIMLLLFVPFVSSALYILIGEPRLGARRLRRYDQIAEKLALDLAADWRASGVDASDLDDRFAAIARYGAAVTGIPPVHGNRVVLLPDNDTFLESIIGDIHRAKHHVHLQTYIWNDDPGADRVVEALIAAAQRGVQCRVLVDGVGSWAFIAGSQWNRMIAAGVRCVEALPVNMLRRPFSRIDLRNHRKIVVIDAQLAFCGSQNIHDSSFRSTRYRTTGAWVDASIRVEGPTVLALAATFIQDWQLDSDEDLLPMLDVLLPTPKPVEQAESVAQVIPSGPGRTPQAIHQAFLTLIYTARDELVMTTPYFVPDEATFTALLAAAARGVRVSIIMPSVSDSLLVAAASRSHYLELLNGGVHIFHYTRGLLHAKTISVDRCVGLMTSANFDNRSFFLNFEVSVLLYDASFAATLRQMQLSYLQASYEVLAPDWRRRPWWRTLIDNLLGLAGPLL